MITAEIAERLAAVRAEPDDDAAREALADAFDAAGATERGRFVRLQLERASLPSWDARVVDLELEERALLTVHEARWRRLELPALPGVRWGGYRRGLAASVAFESVDHLREHAEACAAAAPIERVLVQWWGDGRGEPLPPCGRARELTLVGAIYATSSLRPLLRSTLLARTRRLSFVDSRLESLVDVLEAAPHLEALRVLPHRLGTLGLAPVLDASLPKLRELILRGAGRASFFDTGGSGDDCDEEGREPTAFGALGAAALALWPGLARVETLEVSGNALGRAGLCALLGSRHTANLRCLRVRDVADADWDMDDSLGALAAGPAGSLEELDVGDNDLDAEGAAALAEGAAFRELRVLAMDRLRSRHLDRLREAPWLKHLRVLRCDADVLAALFGRSLPQLHTLVVGPAFEPASIVDALEALPSLASLKVLELSGTHVDQDGLERLGRLRNLPALRELRIIDVQLTEEETSSFAASSLGERLDSFALGPTALHRLPRPTPVIVGHGSYRGPVVTL